MGASDGAAEQFLMDVLCRNLRALREAHELTQADLARAASITRNHYQLLEAGQAAGGGLANPRLSTVLALAEALGVSPVALLTAPSPHSIYRWSQSPAPLTWDAQEALLNALLDSSAAQTEGDGAAFVGVDGTSLTLGLCILAPDTASAVVLSEKNFLLSLQASGLPAALLPDHEVTAGLDGGLVSGDG